MEDNYNYNYDVNNRLGDLLGSGQFGTVYKGVLGSGGGEVEVAVKTLKEGEDRVKFLQEAAIMGQFKHHNVVTMYGVVTEGEPVCFYTPCIKKYLNYTLCFSLTDPASSGAAGERRSS